MGTTFGYFRWAIRLTLLGLAGSLWLGWVFTGTVTGALGFLFVGSVLAVLEISLSFDNAIVNANKLQSMTPAWQRRFLTWGIVIAVFGMRIVFPLLVVVVAAGIGPMDALTMAATAPREYAAVIGEAHLGIAAFGGAFLMMVGLGYFFDGDKEVHWIAAVERPMARCASIRGLEAGLVLAVTVAVALALPDDEVARFLMAALAGLLTFLAVEVLSHLMDAGGAADCAVKGGVGAFVYLEVLDASFSFDGVIGAFALTQNLFLIAIGLGVGAMFVRSMTVMLVDKQTLTEFRYLEHGAFWSILVLSVIMFAQCLTPVPEVVTGLLGAGLIGLAFLSSLRHRRLAAG